MIFAAANKKCNEIFRESRNFRKITFTANFCTVESLTIVSRMYNTVVLSNLAGDSFERRMRHFEKHLVPQLRESVRELSKAKCYLSRINYVRVLKHFPNLKSLSLVDCIIDISYPAPKFKLSNLEKITCPLDLMNALFDELLNGNEKVVKAATKDHTMMAMLRLPPSARLPFTGVIRLPSRQNNML